MNWGRVKTVLIILFLATDIFLLGIYMTSKYSSSTISDEVIEDTVAALANNDITINPDIIPKKTQSAAYAEAENIISDYETFAKNLLGDNIQKIDYGYESPLGKITFYGDRFNYTTTTYLFVSANTETVFDTAAAQDIVTTNLKRLGFDLSSATVSQKEEDNSYVITIENSVNSLPVFNSQVVATISKSGECSLSGIWFNKAESAGSDIELKRVTAALIEFIPQLPEGCEIVKIETGYNIFDKESFHKSATLIPVWQITCKDGSTYLLDARNL